MIIIVSIMIIIIR